ncbi:hypothetical protein BDV11DRAFT_203869 [Aspergillus similis]
MIVRQQGYPFSNSSAEHEILDNRPTYEVYQLRVVGRQIQTQLEELVKAGAVMSDMIGDAIGDAGGQWPSRIEYHQNIEIRPYERSPIEEQTPPARGFAQTDSAVAVDTMS